MFKSNVPLPAPHKKKEKIKKIEAHNFKRIQNIYIDIIFIYCDYKSLWLFLPLETLKREKTSHKCRQPALRWPPASSNQKGGSWGPA
jgi:hypothetical protein